MVRVIEAVGSSPSSWDGAVRDAVRSVKDDAPRPIGVEVTRMWADLSGDSRPRSYRAAVKVAYRQTVVPPEPPRKAPRRASRS